jgi:hypothetical protein
MSPGRLFLLLPITFVQNKAQMFYFGAAAITLQKDWSRGQTNWKDFY